MPQGKLKAKVKVPQTSQKKAKLRKPKGPKKGGELHVENQQLDKHLHSEH